MSDQEPSIITGNTKPFSNFDYFIFSAILGISASISVYYTWKVREDQTLKQYLLEGGCMQILPVMLSMLATFQSAITLLGTPVEIYRYSTIYFYIGIGYVLVMGAAAHIYIPIIYRLHITSAYEYLERRFGKSVRTAGSVTFIVQMTLYLTVVLYAPSLAISAVMGFNLWGGIAAVATVCTIYTALGGMKVVVWTDCFQVFMMVAGLGAVLHQGSSDVGGINAAWEKMDRSGRVLFDDFRLEPNVRHTFWSLVFGCYFTWVASYGVNQAIVQRACSCITLRHAQIALWLNAPGLWIILYLGCLVGVIMYAFYSDCDPVSAGIITKEDQLLPLFVMDAMGDVTGLPGLVTASLFCGTLSTLSAGLNSLATVVLEDIIKGYIVKDICDRSATRTSQGLGILFGCICLLLACVGSELGNILEAKLSLFGMLSGPLLGVFTLGMLFPWANEWGAVVGLASSLIVTLILGIGAFATDPPVRPPPSPVSVAGCRFRQNDTFTPATSVKFTVNATSTTTTTTTTTQSDGVFPMFEVSYLWIGFYAVLTAIVVGLTVSFITGCTRPEDVDPRLICPLFDILPPFSFLPEKMRKPLRFGVVHEGKYNNTQEDTKRLADLAALNHIEFNDILNRTLVVTQTETGNHKPPRTVKISIPVITIDKYEDLDGGAKPVKTAHPKPVKADDAKPVKTDDPTPVKADDPTPLKADDAKPVKADDPKPVKGDDPKPVKADVKGDDPKPVKADDQKPVQGDDTKPVKADDVKSVKTEDDMPVSV
ncbi:sodium-coupled monocarboxylate transporter 1-like [Babylonia areolata]|uniref:sodium-coupled monocarboxylate transporter 1-like n=1 Tax=Babylonia areolata TaxID=304850 RepID=UPI003FCF82EE